MSMLENNAKAHEIACRAGCAIVKDGVAAGLSWTDILISCETVVSIVVLASAEMAGARDKARWATEMVDTMTERAHLRVAAGIKGVPYEG